MTGRKKCFDVGVCAEAIWIATVTGGRKKAIVCGVWVAHRGDHDHDHWACNCLPGERSDGVAVIGSPEMAVDDRMSGHGLDVLLCRLCLVGHARARGCGQALALFRARQPDVLLPPHELCPRPAARFISALSQTRGFAFAIIPSLL